MRSSTSVHGVSSRDQTAVTFICLNGLYAARKLRPADLPATVGRQTGDTEDVHSLLFASKVVSRQHARIMLKDGKYYIKDTQSAGGTFVDHRRLSAPKEESPWTELKDGDVISLGVDYEVGDVVIRAVRFFVQMPKAYRANSFIMTDDEAMLTGTTVYVRLDKNLLPKSTASTPTTSEQETPSPSDSGVLAQEHATSIIVYMRDGDSKTVPCTTRTTVSQILNFMQLQASKLYVIRNRLFERELKPYECPAALQLMLLEQSGFTMDLGILNEAKTKDNSYLVQFICSDEAERTQAPTQALDMSSVVDLSWRNMTSIEPLLQRLSRHAVSRIDLSGNWSLPSALPSALPESICITLSELILTDLGLKAIPEVITQLQALTLLDLSRNALTSIQPTIFATMGELYRLAQETTGIPAGLRTLRLGGNNLRTLPVTISAINCSLDTLSIDNNDLTRLPDVIGELFHLSWLDASNNYIDTIGTNTFARLDELQTLLIAGNCLSSFPASFYSNRSLSFVDARRNRLQHIDDCFGLMSLQSFLLDDNVIETAELTSTSLTTVTLSRNRLSEVAFAGSVSSRSSTVQALAAVNLPPPIVTAAVPTSPRRTISNDFARGPGSSSSLPPPMLPRGSAPNITVLILDTCSLTSLPQTLPVSLQHLRVAFNNISALPALLNTCVHLEILNVSHNRLQSLPSFAGLNKLTTFDCSNNELRFLPAEIFLMPLTQLNASQNKIEFIVVPPSFNPRSSPLVTQLQMLSLARNRLSADKNLFGLILLLVNLHVLDLSYNNLPDLPPNLGVLQRLTELYLSGNRLHAIPDEIEKLRNLTTLTLAENEFTSLPGSIAKLKFLRFLDVSFNQLSYDASEFPQFYNWVWNKELQHLDLSGNENLVISSMQRDALDFSKLDHLKILDLKDVKVQVPVPAYVKRDGRFRRTHQAMGQVPHGLSECLGSITTNGLTLWSHALARIPKDTDAHFFGVMDGSDEALARFIHEKFPTLFAIEVKAAMTASGNSSPKSQEIISTAFIRTFLQLNAEVALCGAPLSNATCSAAFCYLNGSLLSTSNVGAAKAVLIKSSGTSESLSRFQQSTQLDESVRIRSIGGCLERDGSISRPKGVDPHFASATLSSTGRYRRSTAQTSTVTLDEEMSGGVAPVLTSSRTIGQTYLLPYVNAVPFVKHVELTNKDAFVVMANGDFWKFMSEAEVAYLLGDMPEIDCNRRALQLRDQAVAHGARTALMVQVIDLRQMNEPTLGNRKTSNHSQSSIGSVGRVYSPEAQEVKAPTEVVVLVFTDIKSSTMLWEKNPQAMKDAIAMHNQIMREYLLQTNGYEVKTEGDAFMIAFWTVRDAVDWCITIQSRLLEVAWPPILLKEAPAGEKRGDRGELLFRGLTVRMGIHIGFPVCELDPTTGRMDYFGPVVNRAARICSAADGGEIYISADSWDEIVSSEKEKSELRKRGVEVAALDLGEFNLRGLEAPEHLFLLFPKALEGRRTMTRSAQAQMPEMAHHIKAIDIPSSELILDHWKCVRWIREPIGTNATTNAEDSTTKGRLVLTPFYVCFESKFRNFLLRNKSRDSLVLNLSNVRDIHIVTVPNLGQGIEITSTSNESLVFASVQVVSNDLNDVIHRINLQRGYAQKKVAAKSAKTSSRTSN